MTRADLRPLIAAALLSLPAVPAGPEDARPPAAALVLRVGAAVAAALEPGDPSERSLVFTLAAGRGGPVWIESRTLHFDAVITVLEVGEGGRRAKVAEDDNSGPGWNARAAFEARPGAAYLVELRARRDDWGGPVEVAAHAGPPPAPDRQGRASDEAHWDAVEEVGRRTGLKAVAARALAGRGEWRYLNGSYREAAEDLRSALAVYTEILGEAHPARVETLGRLGIALREAGAYDEAKAAFERQAALLEARHGPDHVEVAAALQQLGWLHQVRFESEAAAPLFDRALRIRESSLGPDDPAVASSLQGLAQARSALGRYDAARPLLERVIAVQERSLPADHPNVASALAALAQLLMETGEFAGAERLLDRALAIRERAHGAEHPQLLEPLTLLADLLRERGDLAGSRRLHERCVAVAERTLPPEHPFAAAAAANLGTLLGDAGDPAAARPLLERALGLLEKAHGPEHPSVASLLNALGLTLTRLGLAGEAAAHLDRAVRIGEARLGEGHPHLARYLGNLGRALSLGGRPEAARGPLARAVAVWERSAGRDHPLTAVAILFLALNHLALGEDAAALDLALRAERISIEHLRLTARALPEEDALRYAAARPPGLDLALAVLARGGALPPGSEERVWDALVRSRSAVLDEMAGRRRLLAREAVGDLREAAAAAYAARANLAHLLMRGPRAEGAERYRSRVEALAAERDRLEADLAARGAERPAGGRPAGGSLTELLGALPASTALVAFARTSGSARVGAGAGEEASYLAFVRPSGGGAIRARPLGAASSIDALVAAWKEEASRGPFLRGGDAAAAMRAYREAGSALRRAVWDPIAPLIGEPDRILVVPDAGLFLVNLAALPREGGGYLIEGRSGIHLLSAERDLLAAPAAPAGRGMLSIGGPAFGPGGAAPSAPAGAAGGAPARRPACGSFRDLRFQPLPAAAEEARQVAAAWRRGAEREEAIVLLGGEATEEAFKRLAPGRRILHLATHGFFLGDRCASATAGSRGLGVLLERPAGSPPPPAEGESGLLLAGLALAGANDRESAAGADEDGILTAEEIAALDLGGVEWAVLSACDTGTGDVRHGEGVLGLRRAFQIAGAGALITSLWSVDDEAARRWMRALYEARARGASGTAEAVRAASLDALRARRAGGAGDHPFFWGAFVASGDPR